MDQTLHRMATKEREEIKRTTKQKMARRHNKEGGNHLDKEGNRQTTMEDIDGGLHPAVDGQSLDEDECFNRLREIVPDSATRIQKTGFDQIINSFLAVNGKNRPQEELVYMYFVNIMSF